MTQTPENPWLSDFPDSTEVTHQRTIYYGEDWHDKIRQAELVGSAIDKATAALSPGDVALIKGVHHLQNFLNAHDRLPHLREDIKVLKQQARREQWSAEKLNYHTQLLQATYNLSAEELRMEMARPTDGEYRRSNDTQPVWLRPGHDRGELIAHLSGFTNFRINERAGILTIKLDSLNSGNNSAIAYPLDKLLITINLNSLSIQHNFIEQISIFGGHTLTQELMYHPQIIEFLKEKFAQLLAQFCHSPEDFLQKRNADDQETELYMPLMKYLQSTYLAQNLESNNYHAFIRGLESLSTVSTSAYLRLTELNELILNPYSKLRTTGYYATQYPNVLIEIASNTEKELKKLGIDIQHFQIANPTEVLLKIRTDQRFATNVNNVWQAIFRGKDNATISTLKADLDATVRSSIYNLQMNLYTYALQQARDKALAADSKLGWLLNQ